MYRTVCIECIMHVYEYMITIIPNTAVFGPTNFIGTTIAKARMTVYALSLCTGWKRKISTVAGRGH